MSKKVSVANIPVEAVPALLDEEKVAFQAVNTVNWTTYPYCSGCRVPHCAYGRCHSAAFQGKEASVRAVAGKDNGPVWEDACVEFFSIPAGDGVYYNMECNCAGTLLIGAGAGRGNRQHAPQEVLDKVQRWSSLGQEDFEERIGDCSWEVALVVPYSAFFMHDITSLDGKTLRANFYKCGDISSRLPISCHGIRLIWRSRTSIVRSFSVRCVSSSSRTKNYSTCPHHYHRFSETPYSSPFQG